MKHELREDKTCLNCRQVVEKRYCSNCGQENTDSRKTFFHLFAHFFEDLTHYENAFWKTIKNLITKPGALTREYLSGRRVSYLAPVRLYIFISFLTFFLLSVLPSNNSETPVPAKKEASRKIPVVPNAKIKNDLTIGDYNTVRELDSAQAALPEDKKLSKGEYWIEHRLAKTQENLPPGKFREKFGEALIHNLPKALFLYMPIFALMLWLFHGKKRWYYFDHGIFTLHYFSFLLFTFSFMIVLNSITDFINDDLNYYLVSVCGTILMIWWFFYFFRSHRRFYGESRLVSRLKSSALFIINMFFIILFLTVLILYTAVNLN